MHVTCTIFPVGMTACTLCNFYGYNLGFYLLYKPPTYGPKLHECTIPHVQRKPLMYIHMQQYQSLHIKLTKCVCFQANKTGIVGKKITSLQLYEQINLKAAAKNTKAEFAHYKYFACTSLPLHLYFTVTSRFFN